MVLALHHKHVPRRGVLPHLLCVVVNHSSGRGDPRLARLAGTENGGTEVGYIEETSPSPVGEGD